MKQMLLEGTDLGVACGKCGSETSVRTASNGHQFLGCARWPECNGGADIPASAILATPVQFYRSEFKEGQLILVVVDPESREKYQLKLKAAQLWFMLGDAMGIERPPDTRARQ